jgi:hypothetical protein
VSALRDDVQNILEVAALRIGNPEILRDAIDDVYRILDDEAEEEERLLALVHELENELEDRRGDA